MVSRHKQIHQTEHNPNSTSPSSVASRRTRTLLRMSLVEVRNETGVQNKRSGNPCSFLRSVALPIDQELVSTTSPTDIKDPSYGVHRLIIYQPRKWWVVVAGALSD
ncbi:hypothetical protein ATANTOWER_021954 [Ataeniobius toweri]|uniref:Uncharacterized protein n=1 Tax=Ataeniobius toweri TaxID=208326 RepID=A0ABU7CI31_9TELE|nr:hypothetical protein [Ataeniobius toweri]